MPNTEHGNRAIEILRHGVLFVVGVHGQLPSPAGREHGWTIPLADMRCPHANTCDMNFSFE